VSYELLKQAVMQKLAVHDPKKVYYYKNGKRRGYYPKPKDLEIPEGYRY